MRIIPPFSSGLLGILFDKEIKELVVLHTRLTKDATQHCTFSHLRLRKTLLWTLAKMTHQFEHTYQL